MLLPAEADVEAEGQVIPDGRVEPPEDSLERELRARIEVPGHRPGRAKDHRDGPWLQHIRKESVSRRKGALQHAAEIQCQSLVRLQDELPRQGIAPGVEGVWRPNLVTDLRREQESDAT